MPIKYNSAIFVCRVPLEAFVLRMRLCACVYGRLGVWVISNAHRDVHFFIGVTRIFHAINSVNKNVDGDGH